MENAFTFFFFSSYLYNNTLYLIQVRSRVEVRFPMSVLVVKFDTF